MKKRATFLALVAIAAITSVTLPSAAAPTRPTKVKDEWSQIQDDLSALDKEIADTEGSVAARRAAIADNTNEITFLQAAVAKGEGDLKANNARIGELRKTIRIRAVAVFTGGGSPDLGNFDLDDLAEETSRGVYASVLSMDDDELISRISAVTAKVKAEQRRLAGRKAELEAMVQANEAAATKLDGQLDGLAAKRASLRAKGEKLAVMVTSSTGPVGNGSVCSASGFRVNCSIASRTNQMVAAARSDGVNLAGSAFRNPAEQIALRKSNCGGSDHYTVYVVSPSACSPATARPGASMHERGLAFDFSSCSSSGSACHRWTRQHGAAYGFFNLPGEPWHWSTNGN